MYEQFINSPYFLLLVVWSLVWKGLALWRAARRGDKIWFVVLLVLNLIAIPEIIYLIATNKSSSTKVEIEENTK